MNEKEGRQGGLKIGSAADVTPSTTCCSQSGVAQLSRLGQPFVKGSVQTPVGPVPQISSSLAWADRWGSMRARWGMGRMHYTVQPGLYALGNPDEKAPVLVTANYKMSFDRLREALPDRDAWILVLDTKGINVWCSAAKGTFSTGEVLRRIESIGLAEVVSHRQLILPQLAGPGVAAHQVQKLSGFRVIYGPIRATDLPAFLDAGLMATPEMRRKTFTIWERLVLIPIELVVAFKWTLIILPVFFLIGGLGGAGGFWASALNYGLFSVLSLLAALTAGAVLSPLLLPWLPGRAFSMKGMGMGLITAGVLAVFRAGGLGTWSGRLEILAWFLLVPAVAAYLAMNFTGASTYTSLSGVKKEVKWAVPLEIAAGGVGLCLWLGSLLIM
ncbi:MAG: acetyl-CoA synthase subunit gamma [Deltaproteobacteria bacterium]|nr:MAG: acetyl-CoA synthase subunit gamma [Deltaproteobacteria bacterium]